MTFKLKATFILAFLTFTSVHLDASSPITYISHLGANMFMATFFVIFAIFVPFSTWIWMVFMSGVIFLSLEGTVVRLPDPRLEYIWYFALGIYLSPSEGPVWRFIKWLRARKSDD